MHSYKINISIRRERKQRKMRLVRVHVGTMHRSSGKQLRSSNVWMCVVNKITDGEVNGWSFRSGWSLCPTKNYVPRAHVSCQIWKGKQFADNQWLNTPVDPFTWHLWRVWAYLYFCIHCIMTVQCQFNMNALNIINWKWHTIIRKHTNLKQILPISYKPDLAHHIEIYTK